MKVFVIGAGAMGSGIAQCFAAAKNQVVLNDISMELAQGGIGKIKAGLDRQVARGKMDGAVASAILANIIPTASLQDAAGCDLVVEAAIENMEIKKKIFKELDTICGPDTILSTNTSALPITEIAAATSRPAKVIGMHFSNPAPVIKLVEIIKGIDTSDETYSFIEKACYDLEKVPISVVDNAGFVINRILFPMLNESVATYADGVASTKDIDTAMKLATGHPMGPFELLDLVGIDIAVAILDTLYKELGDQKYRPHPLLRKMLRAGRLGRKTGMGFYSYK